jgi:uncharacterized protein YodC (DUF2158 family)
MFKEGDLVMLKSGGPVMTVMPAGLVGSTSYPVTYVQYFDGEGNLHYHTFPDACLSLVVNKVIDLSK